MKNTMKKLGIFVLILVIFAGYWNFKVYQKTKYLREYAMPFYQACQTQTGCIITPDGWSKNTETSYYKDSMDYSSTKNEFKLSWHIATDVYLVATGGKNQEIAIVRLVE